jgi:hypothetical protein
MSLSATVATFDLLPTLQKRLGEIDAAHRPQYAKVALVALLLADRHREGREWANESVSQVSAALGLSERTVRTCLSALDELGIWVRVGSGNRHSPAKRVPRFLYDDDDLERQADPSPCDPATATGQAVTVGNLERQVEAPRATGNRPRATGQPVDTPTDTPTTTPSLSERDDHRLVREHLEAHVAWNGFLMDDAAAIRRSQRRRMFEVVADAREFGDDPREALEKSWPTGPVGGGDIENTTTWTAPVPAMNGRHR